MSSHTLTEGSVPQRLAHTRELMRREGIHALLVPSADPHLSEYLPGYWQGKRSAKRCVTTPFWSR